MTAVLAACVLVPSMWIPCAERMNTPIGELRIIWSFKNYSSTSTFPMTNVGNEEVAFVLPRPGGELSRPLLPTTLPFPRP